MPAAEVAILKDVAMCPAFIGKQKLEVIKSWSEFCEDKLAQKSKEAAEAAADFAVTQACGNERLLT